MNTDTALLYCIKKTDSKYYVYIYKMKFSCIISIMTMRFCHAYFTSQIPHHYHYQHRYNSPSSRVSKTSYTMSLQSISLLRLRPAAVASLGAVVEARLPLRSLTRPLHGILVTATAALGTYLVPITAAGSSLPLIIAMILTCFLPTVLLGTYRHEYGVSYGYATATSMSAFWIYQCIIYRASTCTISSSLSLYNLAKLHCVAILLHGLRLNTYFLYREMTLPRFRRMRERIEKRQILQDGSRNKFLARLPFLFSCSCLYLCLVMPAYVSMIVADMHRHTPTMMMILYKASLLFTCTFFAFGALGDVHKSISKARLGSHHLVTGGIYKYIRHPNYTGEMMGWITSAISPIWAILASGKSVFSLSLWRKIFIPLLLGFIGALGMAFILSAATCSLEVRQKETYGGMDSYHQWVQRSWAGVSFKPKFKS